MAALEPGADFNKLRRSYIIFICMFDPFGQGLYRYTFEERCLENGQSLGDGTTRMFLNTKGTNDGDVPKELVQFLKYVDQPGRVAEDAEDQLVKRLQDRIAVLKCSRRMEAGYMLFGEILDKARQEGHQEGHQEGRDTMLELTAAMVNEGRAGEIPKLKQDPVFLTEMLKKYHIGQ